MDRLKANLKTHESTIDEEKRKYSTLQRERDDLETAFRNLEFKASQLDKDLQKANDSKKEADIEVSLKV